MKYFLNISGIFDADWDFIYKIIQNDSLFLEFQKIIFRPMEWEWALSDCLIVNIRSHGNHRTLGRDDAS